MGRFYLAGASNQGTSSTSTSTSEGLPDSWWIFLEMFSDFFCSSQLNSCLKKTRKVNGFNKAHREEEDGIEGEEPDAMVAS